MKTAAIAVAAATLVCLTSFASGAQAAPLVQIENAHACLQGHYEYITISARVGAAEISAFDLTIAFQPDALEFVEVLSKTAEVDFERLNPAGIEDSINTGFVRIVGEFGAGRYDSTATVALAIIKFLISNNRSLDCARLPLRFAWIDCGDNRVTLSDGRQIAAGRVFDHGFRSHRADDYGEITDNDCGVEWFAHFCGICGLCDSQPERENLVEGSYWNGLIDLICSDDGVDRLGDINQNGIDNEYGDVRSLADGLLSGFDTLDLLPTSLGKVTDTNHDRVPASIADLIYMVRIVTGDALPFAKLAPPRTELLSAGVLPYPWHSWIYRNPNDPPPPPQAYDSILVEIRGGALVVESDTALGGIFAILELADNQQIDSLTCTLPMLLEQTVIEHQLRVLIWPGLDEIKRSIPSGKQTLFALPPGTKLRFLQASDYNGNLLDVIQVTDSGRVWLPLVFEE